MQDIKEANTE